MPIIRALAGDKGTNFYLYSKIFYRKSALLPYFIYIFEANGRFVCASETRFATFCENIVAKMNGVGVLPYDVAEDACQKVLHGIRAYGQGVELVAP